MLPHRYLGNSGLQVSVLSYGNWLTSDDPEEEKLSIECIKAAHKGGVTFFDTAETYGFGRGEVVMGKALKELEADRRDIVLSTKLWRSKKDGVNNSMLSRKHLVEGMKNSLEKLDQEYVDIVFAHRPDYHTPLEETCRAFDYLIEEGYAFYWATSEWTPDRIAKAMEVCERLDLHKPIADQCQYSMVRRDNAEENLRPLYNSYKYGITSWSPLCGGLLSGKYNDLETPSGSRYADNPMGKNLWARYMKTFDPDALKTKLKSLEELAGEVGCTQAQLCVAWSVANKDITTTIFGASKISQVEDNLAAMEVVKKWTPEIEEKIEKILDNTPTAAYDYKVWAPKKPRRSLRIDYDLGK